MSAMDSAIDSLSTASDHSMASSSDAPAIGSVSSGSKMAQSPTNYANALNNNNNNGSGMQHHGPGNNGGGGNRCSSPSNSPMRHQPSPMNHQMMQMQHQLSPPHVSTPNSLTAGMAPRMAHLPPHSLGLLNSLQMMHHASPLELMAAAHHHVPPRSYNSPPPISTSDPSANECKLVDYRGQKVAAFIISGDTMLCLPQAFELFLKHLVGGLHTVYTKLKRLDIVPLVCNVEQVRILRGLGAIQPGVNRCKLLSCKDFDVLYRDCTTARCLSIKPPESNSLLFSSSRPGRPPKRGPVGLSLPPTHLSQHPQIKKHRDGDYSYENGHINDMSRLEKSPLLANGYNPPPINHMAFMQMNHHPGSALMSPGMPPHGMHRPDSTGGAPMIKSQPGMPGMDAIARSGIWDSCRAAYEDIVKHLERLREERTEDRPSIIGDQKARDLSSRNGSPNRQSPVLNLSKSAGDHGSNGDVSDRSEVNSAPQSIREDENLSDDNISESEGHNEKEEDMSDTERDLSQPHSMATPNSETQRALNYSTLAATAAAAAVSTGSGGGLPSPGDNPEQQSTSSTETLLRNIQSLLKVAADNARQQERQISYEKAELKMDVLREREVKDSLDRQLIEERKLRVLYQKRYRRERKLRIRLQQQLGNSDIKSKPSDDLSKPPSSTNSENGKANQVENKNTDKPDKCHMQDRRRRSESPQQYSRECDRERDRDRDRERDLSTQPPPPPPPPNVDIKPWNYPGIDLMASGAFWQNYSESLAQEIEMERKTRQQSADRDVKSPLQERQQSYYKNSVLFGSAT
ncbi:dachshund homolog 1 isoform X6 [Hermetia illucens]|uniref:dachshund homolog 1 isoform X6 n=1 Tax=Hermetia illucens TaxID=343691 RepID=UPI0018CC1D33|nr:dachshund homolog 1 isoform X6 [Hermetia illucens]